MRSFNEKRQPASMARVSSTCEPENQWKIQMQASRHPVRSSTSSVHVAAADEWMDMMRRGNSADG